MLAGFVVLGAVPIIIHLLNKQRYRVVEWAAVRFLLKSLQKNSRRLQMRDLILLILRTGAVVLAAMAMARPTIAPGRLSLLGAGGPINAVIVLDNSQSMDCLDGAETRFAQAKTRAKAVLEQLPKGSGAALMLMNDRVQAEVPEPSRDLRFVAEAIGKAPLSDGGTDVAAGLSKAWDVLKRASGAREIYLVTDLQANGWPTADNAGWKALIAEIATHKDVRLYLADVGRGAVDDVSVDRLAPEDEPVTTAGDTTFVVTLRRHGPPGVAPAGNLQVELLADDGRGGELRKVASTLVEHLEGTQQVRLRAHLSDPGRHRVMARIGSDRLVADNARFLAVDVVDHLRVLVVDGSPERAAGGATFLRSALSPGVMSDEEGILSNLIQTEVVTPDGVGAVSLDAYQAVVLSDVLVIPGALADALKGYVAAGNGLVIFPGVHAQADSYDAELDDRAHLLPARLSAIPLDLAHGGDGGIGLSTSGLTHPIVSFFAARDTQPYLAQPRFTHAFSLELPSAAKDGKDPEERTVVARLADGHPYLVERRCGNGTVLLFAASADRAWSDLPLRPAFLMLARRAVLRAMIARGRRPTLSIHEAIVATMPPKDAGTRLTLRDPRGGTTVVSAVLSPNGREAVAESAETPFAGFYELSHAGTVLRYAANAPDDEAVIDALDRDTLRQRCPGIDWQWIDEGDVASQVMRGRVGRELWPLLLTLVVCCMLAESVLAARWTPRMGGA
jgi:hypothetical protein